MHHILLKAGQKITVQGVGGNGLLKKLIHAAAELVQPSLGKIDHPVLRHGRGEQRAFFPELTQRKDPLIFDHIISVPSGQDLNLFRNLMKVTGFPAIAAHTAVQTLLRNMDDFSAGALKGLGVGQLAAI